MRSIGCGSPGVGYPLPRKADEGGIPEPGLNVPKGKSLIVRSADDVKTLGVEPDLLVLVVDCKLVAESLVFKDEFEFSLLEWLFSDGVPGVFLPTTAGDVLGETALWLLEQRPPFGVVELLLEVTGVRTRFPADDELFSSGERVFSRAIVGSYGLKLDLIDGSLLMLLLTDGGDVFSLVDSLLEDFDFSEAAKSFEFGASAPI